MIDPAIMEQLFRESSREHDRANLSVDVSFVSESNFLRGVTTNISIGGVFVATEEVLPPGTIVYLRLSLPDREPMATRAIVRWHRAASPSHGQRAGMGLQFLELSDEDRASIQRFATKRAPMYWG